MANLMGMIGLILLVMLLSFAGACACGVGQIFVIPVTIGSFAVAYRTIFLDEGEKAPPDAAAKPNPNAAT